MDMYFESHGIPVAADATGIPGHGGRQNQEEVLVSREGLAMGLDKDDTIAEAPQDGVSRRGRRSGA